MNLFYRNLMLQTEDIHTHRERERGRKRERGMLSENWKTSKCLSIRD